MDLVFLITILFMREREREREREAENLAEREADSPPGAQYGTRSQTPGSHLESKEEAQPLEPPMHPGSCVLSHSDALYRLIEAFSLSAFRVIIQRYELCAFVLPEVLVFLVTFSGPF